MKALIVCGDGINCEIETVDAFQLAGFEVEKIHINDLISQAVNTDQLNSRYSAVALPGGFSFGDDLTSGKILALKIQHGLKWDFNLFVQRGGLVIGICNGFQALIKMGVFGRSVSITSNDSGRFINEWTSVTPSSSKCAWLQGMGTIVLPMRHGEGKIVLQRTNTQEALQKLSRSGMICLKYVTNLNGSEQDIAGLCDATGRIFGLMPHPEAFVRWSAHPNWTKQATRSGAPGEGLMMFENAFRAAQPT